MKTLRIFAFVSSYKFNSDSECLKIPIRNSNNVQYNVRPSGIYVTGQLAKPE